MREIKFRYHFQHETGKIWHIEYTLEQIEKGVDVESRHSKVLIAKCEYTGLKDRTVREIYEGDIVKYFGKWDENGRVVPPDYQPHEIVWAMGGSHAIPTDIETRLDSSRKNWKGVGHTDCEVMGNIYESPELLEEAAKK